MAITPDDKKISQMAEVAPSAGMFVPLVDLTQLPSSQNVRANVGSILALVNLSGYVPTTRAINTSGSLTGGGDLSASRTLSLSGDSASPGNSQYYGTDGGGTKGFFPLPSAGAGTVTSFSSGNLSPLFTTSVATATTTPALSFALSTQSANLVFAGPTNGAAAAPTFRSLVAADIPSLSGVYQPLNANLTAISALTTTSYGLGFLELANAAAARTYIGAGTGSGTVTSVGLTMPSGLSVAGSPITTSGTLAVTTTLSGIVVGDGTGLIARTATGTTDRISITNGSGVAGNPTFDIAATYAGQASITTLGAIATGTWQATTLARNYGGTGFTSYAEGDLLYGNAGSGLSKLAIQTLPGYFLLSGSTPSWAQLSSNVVTSINGTANEITASASTGSVTLSLPSALTFTGKTITGGTYSSGAFNGTVGATTPSTGAFTTIIRGSDTSAIVLASGTSASLADSPGLEIYGKSHGVAPGWANIVVGTSEFDGGVFNIYESNFAGAQSKIFSVSSTGINSTPIGATTPSTGVFTSAQVFNTVNGDVEFRVTNDSLGPLSRANLIMSGQGVGYQIAVNSTYIQHYTTSPLEYQFWTNGAQVVSITSTGINATAIGATTPSTGAFTSIINGSTMLLQTSVALTDGAAASAGTLLNAPAAGNPTKWIPINDNGTTRYVPAW